METHEHYLIRLHYESQDLVDSLKKLLRKTKFDDVNYERLSSVFCHAKIRTERRYRNAYDE